MADSDGRRSAVDRPRRLAFDALRAINGNGGYANLVLSELLTERRLTGRDAGFATELVAGTCRWQGSYDRIISTASGRELKTLQPAVLDLLRLGTHQLLAMRVPAHAAVAAMVDLAGATVGRRVTGLVNAVLRKIAADDLDGWLDRIAAGLRGHDELGVRTAHPRWIVDAYADRLPADELEAALTANNQPAQVSLAVRPGLAEVNDLLEAGAQPGRWSPYAAGWPGAPGESAAVRSGRAGVQDEGSQLVATGLARAEAPAGRWLDLCAGPGGKSALLAGLAAANGDALLAAEVAPHRADLVSRAVRAYPAADRPTVIVADGTLPAWRPGSFARVIADVPCTGLGALRRRPESRWRRDAADVEPLHALQVRLLRTALDSLIPGGVAAYVTCSPHRRETVDVVDEVLAERDDIEVLEAGSLLPGIPDSTTGPYLQLWPHRHGTDAMFAAYLRRSR